jgi:hypothetical protein
VVRCWMSERDRSGLLSFSRVLRFGPVEVCERLAISRATFYRAADDAGVDVRVTSALDEASACPGSQAAATSRTRS